MSYVPLAFPFDVRTDVASFTANVQQTAAVNTTVGNPTTVVNLPVPKVNDVLAVLYQSQNATTDRVVITPPGGTTINGVEGSLTMFVASLRFNDFGVFQASSPTAWSIIGDRRTPHSAQIVATTGQSIPNNVETLIQFDTAIYNLGDIVDLAQDRITLNRPAIVAVSGGWGEELQLKNNDQMICTLTKNGVNDRTAQNFGHGAAQTLTTAIESTFLGVAGDFFQLEVLQDSGGAITVSTDVTRRPIPSVTESV